MPFSDPPFRTESPPEPPPEVLEAANDREARMGAECYLPRERERWAIARVRSEDDLCGRWFTHPDEDVRTRFFRKLGDTYRVRQAVRADLRLGDAIEAALAEARAEGLIWTPLLDAIAVSVRAEARNALRHAMRLGKWIQEQTDANRLLPLLRFRCGDICWLLGLNARVFSPALLDGLIEHPVALKKAATNPALDAANATYLLGLARRAVGRSDSRSKTLIETAEILLQRLFHWTINDRRALARRLGGLPGERRDAATLLTLDTETSTRLLERVRTAEGIGFDALSNIAAHPNAPIGMLRQLAKQWHLRPVLIERPEARADAEIRAQLLHTTAGEHLRLLARETRGAEFLGIWRRLVRLQPGTAIEMLEAGEVPDDVTLGPEELAPLFHAKDREVRLRAMLAVSEAGSPAERPAMPCCDSDRRTRTPSA